MGIWGYAVGLDLATSEPTVPPSVYLKPVLPTAFYLFSQLFFSGLPGVCFHMRSQTELSLLQGLQWLSIIWRGMVCVRVSHSTSHIPEDFLSPGSKPLTKEAITVTSQHLPRRS
jgi:hypothetical protein